MASTVLLRAVHGAGASRVFGAHMLKFSGPRIPKKCLHLSAPTARRVYGPPEAGGKWHTQHFKSEKILSAALIPIIPACLIYPNVVTDTLLAATVLLHTHWGLQAVCSDYIHGAVLPKIAKTSLLVLSIVAFGALCHLNYFDCGLGNAIRMVYSQL